jgi:hypothetical protein
MIFYRTENEAYRAGHLPAKPVWQAFLDTQKRVDPSYGIVLQSDHARLAGDLAAILSPDLFGPLPPEVIDAVSRHDFGWKESDEAQLRAIERVPLRPFPILSPDETLPSWHESIRLAEKISPLAGVIVSRHLCALATQYLAYRPFLEREAERLERIESGLGLCHEDLDRWTGAIGFCDALSLYLCCGATEPVEVPLAHSSLPESKSARRVVVERIDERLRMSAAVVKLGETVSVMVRDRQDQSPLQTGAKIHGISIVT